MADEKVISSQSTRAFHDYTILGTLRGGARCCAALVKSRESRCFKDYYAIDNNRRGWSGAAVAYRRWLRHNHVPKAPAQAHLHRRNRTAAGKVAEQG